jgi:spermidine synthase
MVALQALREEVSRVNTLRCEGGLVLVLLFAGFLGSEKITHWTERSAYADPIIFSQTTRYQRIVLTRAVGDLRLHLNGNLQFSSRDEYRYHETLVHPGLARLPQARRVLVLGGGDGLAIREILRYPQIEKVVLVELDPEMTKLFASQEMLVELNQGALRSPKVEIVNTDAFTWLKESHGSFDFIVADFPDPSNFSLGKLYTTTFFERVWDALAPRGAFVVQCTSPYVARQSFWCVDATLQRTGFVTAPYHVLVPSFGEWGFILASREPLTGTPGLPQGLRFLEASSVAGLFEFPPDMARVPTEVNRLNNQVLVRYFESEWDNYVH